MTAEVGFYLADTVDEQDQDGGAFTHSFCFDNSLEVVEGKTINKKYDEVRLCYPDKTELYVDGKYLCNRESCGESFDTHRDRNKHIREVEKPVLCPHGCGTRMAYQGYMKKHCDSHKPEGSRQKFTCLVCRRSYMRLEKLTKHKNKKGH
ncbi:hypothetical protein B0I35DRAFT_61954 [Stachybotrys elegans]|uniref:C2H2-type domain-containing protein n=1 Tax=Stachybotrys elegans TaxID=80388 RepID=A0A8K0SLM2_9HYPO|nr:hypothetical protein B0I35DRAFT_61954 [Stachybotrys elegans]